MVDATTTPPVDPLPAFLSEWEKTKESKVSVFQEDAGPLQIVTLFDFKFLGGRFQPASQVGRQGVGGPIAAGTRRQGTGVCAELRDALFRAQRLIYRSYAAEEKSQGREPTEGGFATWCGRPVLSGWQFRSKQHGRGAAIDVDATYNPWIATKTGEAFGGENHRELTAERRKELRRAAVGVYERAFKLRHGVDMPANAVSAAQRSDPTGPAYDRFLQVHDAVRLYFHLGFVKSKNNRVGTSIANARQRAFDDSTNSSSFQTEARTYRSFLKGFPTQEADVKALFEQIVKDYDLLRPSMVYLSLRPQDPGFNNMGVTFGETRDPCYGFLNFRREIAIGIRAEVARWGAIDFGPDQCGDMMHFDLGPSASIATTTDPNPDGLVFVSG